MMVYVHIRGTGVVLQVPRDSANPTMNGLKSWVDHEGLKYDIYNCRIFFLASKYKCLFSELCLRNCQQKKKRTIFRSIVMGTTQVTFVKIHVYDSVTRIGN